MPPYYAFTPADRAWTAIQPGDIWTFTNKQGARNRFQVDSAVLRMHQPVYTSFAQNPKSIDFYHDTWSLYVRSLDSARQVGSFKFGCVGDGSSTRLYADCEWATYIGVDSGVGGFIPCWLGFPADLRPTPLGQLAVGGQQYSRVLFLRAVGQPTTHTPYGLRTSVREFYYDQQMGVIQLVEDGGQVWSRVR